MGRNMIPGCRRLLGSASIAFILVMLGIPGCAQYIAPEPVIGTFTLFNRQAPYLIAAPHGEFDENTAEIVYDFCDIVRWDCLVAEGFRDSPATINVNRPTEGLKREEARFTGRAKEVYDKYVKRIQRLSPTVKFYAEIHGHAHAPLRDTVDVATVGITEAQAQYIQDLFTRELHNADILDLQVRVDVLEPIRYNATHARNFGVLSFIQPAVHIELPTKARKRYRKKTALILSKVLPQVATKFFPPDASAIPSEETERDSE